MKETRQKKIAFFMLIKICLVLAFLLLCNSMFNRQSNACNNPLCYDRHEDQEILPIKRFHIMEGKTFYSSVKRGELKKINYSYLSPMNKLSDAKEYQSEENCKIRQLKIFNTYKRSEQHNNFNEMNIFQFSNMMALSLFVLVLTMQNHHLKYFDQKKNIRPGILFWILLCLMNIVHSAGPLKYEPAYMPSGDGKYNSYVGISAKKGSGYCIYGIQQMSSDYSTFVINKFASDESLISTQTRGAVPSGKVGSYNHIGVYSSGVCKMFYSDANGQRDIGFKFFGGLSGDTDASQEAASTLNINKAIALSDGTFVAVGIGGDNSYIVRVSAANVILRYNTEYNMEYRSVMEMNTNILIILAKGQNRDSYLKQTTLGLVYGYSCPTSTYAQNKDARDAIFTADSKVLIVGSDLYYSAGYLTKTSTMCSTIWNVIVPKSMYYSLNQVIQLRDGSFIAAGHCYYYTYYIPWLVSVSNDGVFNWESTYTGSAYSTSIYGVDAIDDYSVTLVGNARISDSHYVPFILKTILACPSGGTDCVQGGITSCKAGTYMSSGSCLNCAPGTYSAALATSCSMCSEGSYQDKSGQSSCINCPMSKISTEKGSTSCTDCPYGYYVCQEGSTTCKSCPKKYCGPCQLDDRNACLQLNDLCWSRFDDKCAPVTVTWDCLLAVSKICYKIWLANGLSDIQCIDFASSINLDVMKARPNLLSASYAADGQSIILEFDRDMSRRGINDASAVFDSDTLRWFPNTRSIQWISFRILKVDYSPEVGLMEKLNILPNALYSSYMYAQEAVEATNFPVSILNEVLDQSAGSRNKNRY